MPNRADNFDRTESPLTVPSDGGSAWVNSAGGTNGAGFDGVSGRFVGFYTTAGSAFLDCSATDCDTSATYVRNDNGWGVTVRAVDDNNYYLLNVNNDGSNQIFKKVSGSFTQLASGSLTVSLGDTVELGIVGSNLTAKINGSTTATATDGTLTAGTGGGIRAGGGIAFWDDFAVTVSGGGGTTWTVSVADNYAESDAVKRIANGLRKVSDNYAEFDSASRIANTLRLVQDNYAESDAFARLVTAKRLVQDNYGESDLFQRVANALRVVADNYAIGDAASASTATHWLIQVADNYAESDAFARVASALRLVQDNVGESDNAKRVANALRQVADNFAASDAFQRVANALRVVRDNFGESDSAATGGAFVHMVTVIDFFAIRGRGETIPPKPGGGVRSCP